MTDPRLHELQDLIVRLAGGQLEARASVSERGDDVDALAVGLNLLAEVLEEERHDRLRAEGVAVQHERDKMDALAHFSAGVAHDLNNLLSVVLLVSSTLRARVDAEGRELLDDLELACERGTILARHLKSLRTDGPPALRCSPSVPLQSAGRLAMRAATDGVEVHVAIPEALPEVSVDPMELERVVMNLVRNSIEAMPRGGLVSLEAVARDRHVLVRVKDSGEGMSEATRQRAVEPRFTTKPEGTGFGLSHAYALAERSGGDLRLSSSPGEGTTVTLRLPT